MMLRVRPAQWTTIVVDGSGARLARTQDELCAGYVRAGRDCHRAVLVRPAYVEDDDVGSLLDQRVDVLRWQRGRVPPCLHKLSKCLAVRVDVLKRLEARRAPPLQAALENAHVRVPEPPETSRALFDEPVRRRRRRPLGPPAEAASPAFRSGCDRAGAAPRTADALLRRRPRREDRERRALCVRGDPRAPRLRIRSQSYPGRSIPNVGYRLLRVARDELLWTSNDVVCRALDRSDVGPVDVNAYRRSIFVGVCDTVHVARMR